MTIPRRSSVIALVAIAFGLVACGGYLPDRVGSRGWIIVVDLHLFEPPIEFVLAEESDQGKRPR